MSNDLFERCFSIVVEVEGGDQHDCTAKDRGNWTSGVIGQGELRGTRYGISAAAYPNLDISGLTLDGAREIYRRDYWDPVCGSSLPAAVALLVFDCAVNQGVTAASRMLQQAVGSVADGKVGPHTIQVAWKHSERDISVEIMAQRILRYAADSRFDIFGLGWSRRLARVAFDAAFLAAEHQGSS
jgi:lysozyme family protein